MLQARLGQARLRWSIDLPTAALAQAITPCPPLTLVDNAVGHGIGRLLSGGR